VVRAGWLGPLAIIVTGTVLTILAHLVFASFRAAAAYAFDALQEYAIYGAVAWLAFFTAPGKQLLDQMVVALPWLRELARDVAANRFFHTMNVLYSTGGMRVETMIRNAAKCIDNHVLRADYDRAAQAIESGETIGEAFAVPTMIPVEHKTTLRSGDEAGKLEEAFHFVARRTGEDVECRVRRFREIACRVVGFFVMMSLAFTLMGLISSLPRGE
jgi:type II secretory pathway component PulF